MNIVKKSEIFKFDSPIGEPELDSYWYDSEYHIERLVEDNKVIWFGLNTNWKFENDKWFKLVDSEFVECSEPIYETKYKELVNPF